MSTCIELGCYEEAELKGLCFLHFQRKQDYYIRRKNRRRDKVKRLEEEVAQLKEQIQTLRTRLSLLDSGTTVHADKI